LLEIDDDQSVRHRAIVEKIMARVKQPHNYGLSAEEQELHRRQEIHQKEKFERENREERQRSEEDGANDLMRKQTEWTRKLEQIKHEEYEMLDAQDTPLRNYLMMHVMPTLTKALVGMYETNSIDINVST
jgi:adenylate kinase